MKTITHYEVYLVKLGRWTLQSRMGAADQERAIEHARMLEINAERPTQVIEESLEPESGRLDIRVVVRPSQPTPDIKPPDSETNIASRVFMVAINAIGIGAIVAVLVAVGISAGRDRMDFPAGTYNLMLFFAFGAAALSAVLVLVRMYIPMELILWRAKSPESQQRTAQALLYGTSSVSPAYHPLPPREKEPEQEPEPTSDAPEAAPAANVRLQTNADQGEQTSFQLAALDTNTDGTGASPNATDSAADLLASLLAPHAHRLAQFADAAAGVLFAARPPLQAFERYGFNLYLAGAALAVAEQQQFDGNLKDALIQQVVVHAGTSAATAQSFCERIEAAAQRPRYRALMEAGRAAFTAQSAAETADAVEPHTPLPGLIQQWADPAARGRSERVTFLLTDLVGSTALTSKLGNSGAQRVVRAHNTIVRQALKDFKGKEIKHTGDGLLLTFSDAVAAARAAIEIQQAAFEYARDNADAPLSLRVGLHAGDASFEDGEYYGEAVLLLDGICATADAAQISCTENIRSRCPGSMFRFADVGLRPIKGSDLEQQIFLLEWMPKAAPAKGPIEYRHIGTKPQPAA